LQTKGKTQFYNISLRYLLLFPFIFLIFGCSSVQRADVGDIAIEAAIKLVQPSLEKIFLAQTPVSPSSRNLFPVVKSLPGQTFDPIKSLKKSIDYDSKGI